MVVATMLVWVLAETRGWMTLSVGVVAVQPVPGVAALAGLLFGPMVVVGAVAGYLIHLGTNGLGTPLALWEATGYLFLGWFAYALWGNLGPLSSGHDPGVRSTAHLREFLIVAVISALSATVIVAWGFEVVGYLGFYPASVIAAVNTSLSVIIFGGALLSPFKIGVQRSTHLAGALAFRSGDGDRPTGDDGGIPIMSVLLPVLWIIVANAIDAGYQVLELVPVVSLRERSLDLLLAFKGEGLLGNEGMALQAAIGGFVLVLWIASMRREDVT